MAFCRERGRSHRVADHSALFSWYIAHFGAYNATYESLGGTVGTMMWISAIVLLGGELNAEIEHQTAKDSMVG
jgi:membrane protein